MRAGFVEFETLAAITAQLTPANRLVCEIALATGLRVSDVLGLRIERLNLRPTVIEQKTGKRFFWMCAKKRLSWGLQRTLRSTLLERLTR